MGLHKTFIRTAAAATLLALLTVGAQAQSIARRAASVTDDQIRMMLTTRDSEQVRNYLTLSLHDVIEVFGSRLPAKAGGESKFLVAKFNKNDQYEKNKLETHPRYGNPTGVFHPGFGKLESGAFLANTIAEAIQNYDGDMKRLKDVADANSIPASDYLPQFDATTQTISLEPVGAIRGIRFDLRGNYRGMRAARVEFFFEPDGKEPLYCQGDIPYTVSEIGKSFITIQSGLRCRFDGEIKRLVMPTDEIPLEDYVRERGRALAKNRASGTGFCDASCSSSQSMFGRGFSGGSSSPSGYDAPGSGIGLD